MADEVTTWQILEKVEIMDICLCMSLGHAQAAETYVK